MFRILFKTSLRNILRNGVNSSINLLSLTIGFSISIVIYTIIEYQYSFDHFHENADQVYRVNFVQQNEWGTFYGSQTPEPLHKVLRADYPQIEAVSRTIGPMEVALFVEDRKFDQQRILFVDEYFFQLFDQRWLRGNKNDAFKDPKAVILTESTAKKLFGDEDPMGKTIDFSRRDLGVVKGIVKDPRLNTNLPYTMIAHVSMMKQIQEFYVRDNWENMSIGTTWVLLPKNVDANTLAVQLGDIVKKNLGDELAEIISFDLAALKTLHTDDRYGNGVNYSIPSETIYGLVIIAFIVLATCSINFINLSTANALKRSQEIGIKKILGSSKKDLATQFFIELSMITFLAAFLSLWFAELLLNQINSMLSIVAIDLQLEPNSFLFTIILTILITFLAGLYPVGLLLKFKPLETIKGKFTQLKGGKAVVRNSLLTIQFVFAQILVIVVLVFSAQSAYIENKDLGYETENIVMFRDFMKSRYMVDGAELATVKAQLLASPYIQKVSYGTGGPNANYSWNTSVFNPLVGDDNPIDVDYKHVDIDYQDMFQLKVIAGTWFTQANYLDELQRVLVTKLLAEKLGWTTVENSLGQRINVNGAEAIIIGVLADFHTDNLKNAIKPSVFEGDFEGYNQGFMKIQPGYYKEATAYFESISTTYNQDYTPNYVDFTEELAADYEQDRLIARFINFTAFLALAIGSLGLYSLISFIVQQKTKELGIRKVIGANSKSLILMISSKYIWLILLATILAAPLGYLGAELYLDSFAYRTEIGITQFVLAFIITTVIAIASISYRAYRASTMNPVTCLRYE
jgi:ABC-type antimicrobial peptide transport system permease subunit